MHACPLGVWWGMSRRVHIQPFRGRCRPGMTERMWGHFLLVPLPHSPSGSVPTALHAVAVTGRLPPPGDPDFPPMCSGLKLPSCSALCLRRLCREAHVSSRTAALRRLVRPETGASLAGSGPGPLGDTVGTIVPAL